MKSGDCKQHAYDVSCIPNGSDKALSSDTYLASITITNLLLVTILLPHSWCILSKGLK